MIDTRMIVRLPMLSGNDRICPYCNESTSEESARCGVIVNGQVRPLIQTVLYCKTCKLYFGNSIIVSRIDRNCQKKHKKSNNPNSKKSVRRIPKLAIEGKEKDEVYRLMYDDASPASERKKRNNNTNRQPPLTDNQVFDLPFIRNNQNISFNRIISKIYPVPIDLKTCPKCHRSLWENYVHVIPISKELSVALNGQFCEHCNAFYSSDRDAVAYLKLNGGNTHNYAIIDDYVSNFDQARVNNALFKIPSFYRLFFLISELKLRVLTVVFSEEDENTTDEVYFYSHPIALKVLTAEKYRHSVVIAGTEYQIEKTINSSIVPSNIHEAINQAIMTEHNNDQELSVNTTLYVYKGNIKCNYYHEIIPYRAEIKALDRRFIFLVYYCIKCKRFMMKYADYEPFLRGFHFFPLRVKLVDNDNDWYDFDLTGELADESPLMLMGYNVNASNGLSARERQRILAYIIDNDILSDYSSSQRKVLDYLEFFIANSRNRPERALAVSKWEEDRRFVLNYRISEHPSIEIGKLKRWK